MDNKLQQLTQKLYEEGLSKGRSEAEKLIANAKVEADSIIKKARADAEEIKRKAEKDAVDLKRNTDTEIILASKQMLAVLKQQIESLVITKQMNPAVEKTVADKNFIKDIILVLAKNWNIRETELSISLPPDAEAELEQGLKKELGAVLGEGFEITLDKGVRSGFRLAPKDGGYYISFTDSDFETLFKEFLRPKLVELLYRNEDK